MDIAVLGLGKMGANMTTRLLRGGHNVVVFDLNMEAIQTAEAEGAEGAQTLDQVVNKLSPPRAIWVMVPAGEPTSTSTYPKLQMCGVTAACFAPGCST